MFINSVSLDGLILKRIKMKLMTLLGGLILILSALSISYYPITYDLLGLNIMSIVILLIGVLWIIWVFVEPIFAAVFMAGLGGGGIKRNYLLMFSGIILLLAALGFVYYPLDYIYFGMSIYMIAVLVIGAIYLLMGFGGSKPQAA